MAELSVRDGHMLTTVRRLHGLNGVPIEASLAVACARGLTRHQATRALASLTAKGLLSKPRRGYYLPTEEKP